MRTGPRRLHVRSVLWHAAPGAVHGAATASSRAPASAAGAFPVLLPAAPAAEPVATSAASREGAAPASAAVSTAEPPAVSAAATAAAAAVSAAFAARRPGFGYVERVVIQLGAAELHGCLKGGVVRELQIRESLSQRTTFMTACLAQSWNDKTAATIRLCARLMPNFRTVEGVCKQDGHAEYDQHDGTQARLTRELPLASRR